MPMSSYCTGSARGMYPGGGGSRRQKSGTRPIQRHAPAHAARGTSAENIRNPIVAIVRGWALHCGPVERRWLVRGAGVMPPS